jgi:hypothetical protein
MTRKTVTHVPERVLPMSTVYTPEVEGVSQPLQQHSSIVCIIINPA